jgi:hypothetical protein
VARQDIEVRVVDKTKTALQNIDRRLDKVQGSLISINKIAGLAVAALGAVGGAAIIRSTVNTIRTFEDLEQTLITIEGNAVKAAHSMKLIEDFTAGTTFQLDEVTNAFITFKNAGLQPTTEFMTNVGNIAAGMGKRIDTVAQAVFNATTGEFEMLKQLGIKVKTEGDKLTVNFRGTAHEIENDGKAIIKFIEDIGEAEFAGSLERQANTLSGALSNLQDNVSLVQKAFGEGGFKTALTEFTKFMQDAVIGTKDLAGTLGEEVGFAIFKVTEFLKENNFTMAQFIEGAKIAGAVLGGAGLIAILKGVTSGIKAMTLALARNPIGLIAVAAASAITYLSMENGLGRTIAQVGAVLNKLGEIAASVARFFKDSLGRVIGFLTGIFDGFVDSVISGYNAIAQFIPFLDEVETSGKEVRESLKNLVVDGYEAVSTAVVDTTEKIVDYVSSTELAQSASESVQGVIAELTQAYQAAGISYDEANAKAREQYEALVQSRKATDDQTNSTNEMSDAANNATGNVADLTESVKNFQKGLREGFEETSIVAFTRRILDLEKAYEELSKTQVESAIPGGEDFLKSIQQDTLAQELEFLNQRQDLYLKYLDAKEKALQKSIFRELTYERKKMSDLEQMFDTGLLKEIGRNERLKDIVDKRIEFEKMSELGKTQFALEQGVTMFEGLSKVNKKFFAAQKAAAIALAIVNTYQGATKALATYPPPFNFIAAAATVASGLAQVATIRAQTMQRGGALPQGQAAIVGEDGPELIVPKQPSTVIPREVADAIDNMGGRGGDPVVVNFNITTVDAESFDTLLIRRRGTITSIINGALQKRGKEGVV